MRHLSIYASLVFWALVLPFAGGLLPIVRFAEETIDVEVHPDHVRVNGVYVYRNPFPFPVVQGFSIPLPVDADHPFPSSVAAWRLGPEDEDVPLPHILGRHRFELRFAAHEEVRLRVAYRQQAPAANARYILTTTEPWRRPLERGLYRVFPRNVTITSSNYNLKPGPAESLVFVREDFMPPADWYLAWRAHP